MDVWTNTIFTILSICITVLFVGWLAHRHKKSIKPSEEINELLIKLSPETLEEVKQELWQSHIISGSDDQTAARLKNFFHNKRLRVLWEERPIETVLTDSGMTENQDYFINKNAGGYTPDVVLRFLDGANRERFLPIYDKFPLPVLDNTPDEEIIENFCREARQTVRLLSAEEYDLMPDGIGWVIMYVPAESLYSPLTERPAQSEPSVVEEASYNRVLIMTPSCLIAIASLISVAGHATTGQTTSNDGSSLETSPASEADIPSPASRKIGKRIAERLTSIRQRRRNPE